MWVRHLILLFASSFALSLEIDPFVVNGNDALPGQFTYFVSLRYNFTGYERHGCGGSILNQRWVLTAAHCTEGVEIVGIVAGIVSVDASGFRYQAIKVINHPLYLNVLWVINDISLIQTDRPIAFNELVQPIAMSRRNVRGNVIGTLAGFGATTKELEVPPWIQIPPSSETLKYISKQILSDVECRTRTLLSYLRGDFILNPFIYKHICTLAPYGTGICAGDSGSGLVVGNEIVGIASFVLQYCARGHPEFYVRVSEYANWIDGHINACINETN